MLLDVKCSQQNEQYLSAYNSVTMNQIMQEYGKERGASQMLSGLGSDHWQIRVH